MIPPTIKIMDKKSHSAKTNWQRLTGVSLVGFRGPSWLLSVRRWGVLVVRNDAGSV